MTTKVKEPFLYKLLIPLNKILMLFYRVTYINKDNIPKTGGFILAGNHTSYLDPLLLASSTNRTIHFLAKIELMQGIKKYFFKAVGIIPVDRSRKNPEVINSSNQVLTSGKVIGIFPEGTINRGKEIILPFKKGAVKMASDTNCQIVPFSITGKYKFLRKSVTISFDSPYTVSSNIEKETKILEDKIINLIRSNNKWKKNIKKVIYFLKPF